MDASRPPSLQRLIEAEMVTPARVPKQASVEPVAVTATVSDLVSDQRR